VARNRSEHITATLCITLHFYPSGCLIASRANICRKQGFETGEIRLSRRPPNNPVDATPDNSRPVETVIVPRTRDLGGFDVRRVLPSSKRRMIGPFIFFDQMGPARLDPGTGVDVRPHPHIGLSTVTWLIEGEIMHRDSLGSAQPIRPGEVNWMTAGSGIVHSERTPPDLRPDGPKLYGLQTWLALPQKFEETEPSFEHFKASELPTLEGDGIAMTLVAGHGWGKRSPVGVFSETLYADIRIDAGATLTLPAEHEERGLYILAGEIEIEGERFEPGAMLVLRPGNAIDVQARMAAHVMAVGGESADGPRHIWWNLVSSSKERIEQAKEDWKAGRFASVPGDAEEFIPLPED
jgi:redox-sensitive bicupin YhaK (pirin superfamily)